MMKTLLVVAAFIVFWSLIVNGVYIVAKELGFSEEAAYGSAIIASVTMLILYFLVSPKLTSKR